MKHYMLTSDRQIVTTEDTLKWGRWYEAADQQRIVAQTQATPESRVSTVFLGLDHNFGDGGGPVLFETMVFGGPLHEEQERYHTWEEAEAGHAVMLERVLRATAPAPGGAA